MIPVTNTTIRISYLPETTIGLAANHLLEQWAIQEVNRAVNRWLYTQGE